MEERKRCQWCGGPLDGKKERWCSLDCATNGNVEDRRYKKALASPAGRDGYYKTSLRIIKRRVPMRLSSSLTSLQWANLTKLYDDFAGGTEEEVKLHELVGRVLDATGKEPLSKALRNEIKRIVHNKTGEMDVTVKVVTSPWKDNWPLIGDPSLECMREGFRALVKVKAGVKSTYYQLDLRCTPDAGPEVGIWETNISDMSSIGSTQVFRYPREEKISKEGLLKFIEKFNWKHFMRQAHEEDMHK